MPQIAIAALVFGGGFVVGKGLDGVGNTLKWVVAGGALYMGGKYLKVI